MFVDVQTVRDYTTIPSTIFSDERISLGAKGLYVQLIYSTKSITSLADLVSEVNNSKEELDQYFNELCEFGYIIFKNKRGGNNAAVIVNKPQKKETVEKKLDQEVVQNYTEKVIEQAPKLSKYELLVQVINSFGFDPKVTNLLIVYFEKWLNRRGRFSDADELHAKTVRAKIGELVSYHMSDEDMITCIQNSIDKEWFKFVDTRKGSQPDLSKGGRSSFIQFDKDNITSGSYTQEDIERVKQRAAQLEAEGQKGVF